MNYIIFDMEWNQPSSSESAETRLRHGEIIQIGFFLLDSELKIKHSEKINIKPVVYTVMNKYVSVLTGISQWDIDHGTDFVSAVKRMAEFFSEDTVIMTWGDDDMPLLRDNLAFHGIEDLALPKHYNLQRIYAMQNEPTINQTGLKTAMEKLGISADVQAHEALNDAYMTVLIARKLDIEGGIEEYEKSFRKKKKNTAVMPWEDAEPIYTVSAEYSGSMDGMAAVCRKMDITCPVCGEVLDCDPLCRQGKCSFISMPVCEHCGTSFLRFELKDGQIIASCFESGEKFEAIFNSKLREREKRRKYRELYKLGLIKRKSAKK